MIPEEFQIRFPATKERIQQILRDEELTYNTDLDKDPDFRDIKLKTDIIKNLITEIIRIRHGKLARKHLLYF